MKKVNIYADGACSGNPGAGGWGTVMLYGEHIKKLSGFCKDTTNNRMEIFSIIQGLANLKEPCEVTIFSDSAYVVDTFNKGWLENWKKNNWRNSQKEEVKNRDLWNDLMIKMTPHQISFVKVKGHSDNVYNNMCDELARGEIKRMK